MTKPSATLERLCWADVRKDVSKVNPELAKHIDQINPGKEYTIYKACYPFGCGILREGELHLPNEDHQVVPLNDPSIDNKIKKDLAYTQNMPMGMVLKKSINLFSLFGSQITPWIYMFPGRIFGLWGLLKQHTPTSFSSRTMWHISAGSRFFFLLAKVSNVGSYKRIRKEFALRTPRALGLLDQWPMLVELANSPQFPKQWQVELLYFSDKWLKRLNDSSSNWQSLTNFLLRYTWEDTAFLREQSISDFVLSLAMTNKNLRPNPYLADTFRHIYSLIIENEHSIFKPGFRFADSNIAGPVKQIQEIFDQVYDLKFMPTIVHPGLVKLKDPLNPVYYSLEVPTVWSYLPKSRKAANKLNDLREIKHIQSTIYNFILEDSIGLFDTPIYQRIKNIEFDYYHSDEDALGEVLSSKEILARDKVLLAEQKRFNKPFCHTSPFLRGCVRIGIKEIIAD